MAGEINFGAIDPNAFYQGAANSNALMQRWAQRRAGQYLAKGDRKGATDTLNREGMLGDANQLGLNLDAEDQRLAAMTQAHRQTETQMIIDTASVLDKIRGEQGDAAVLPAFERLAPLFKEHGATDEELDVFRKGLGQNPGEMLQAIHSMAANHLKQYTLTPGAKVVDSMGGTIAEGNPVTKTIGPGGQVVQIPPSGQNPTVIDNAGIPPEAIARLAKGHVTTFGNGQQWTIGEDGKPQRVK